MSEFFRMAAQCDRSIASTAPVELYSCPPVDSDEEEDNNTTTSGTGAGEQEVLAIAEGGGGEQDNSSGNNNNNATQESLTERIRAVLDTQHAQSTRKNLLREANVSRIETVRENKAEARFREVEHRHMQLREESLLNKTQAAAAASSGGGVAASSHDGPPLSPRSQARAEEQALVAKVKEMELVKVKNEKVKKQKQGGAEDNFDAEAGELPNPRKEVRDPFELLRMEERRRLQLYNTTNFDTSGDLRGVTSKSLKGEIPGGIIGMYNEATLDSHFESDGRPRTELGVASNAFPTNMQREKDAKPAASSSSLFGGSSSSSSAKNNNKPTTAASNLIIPKQVGSLVQEGYGQDKASKLLLDLNRKRELLRDQQLTVLAEEGAEREQAKSQQKLQDSERQVMLTEFVVQDNERSRLIKEDLAATKVAQERSKLNYAITVKPEHPIDVYHQAIREDVFGEKKKTQEDKQFQQKLKALAM